jgi:GrpB-like predicted nucleotidyltransferase (UPF0157 family)
VPVEITEYDPAWPAAFDALAAELRAALGPLAARIDHIGSTSVPGLAAKDRIDLQVGIPDLDEVGDVARALEATGYRWLPDITSDHVPVGGAADPREWRKAFFQPPPQRRPANVHVREIGRANWRYAILFRDFLRATPTAAGSYAELKRRLGPFMPDGATYADVKDPAVDLIMIAAESWADATGWRP